jgi:hypothetical protein
MTVQFGAIMPFIDRSGKKPGYELASAAMTYTSSLQSINIPAKSLSTRELGIQNPDVRKHAPYVVCSGPDAHAAIVGERCHFAKEALAAQVETTVLDELRGKGIIA